MNIYQPHLMTIREIRQETADTRTFRLTFNDPFVAEKFDFRAGQFGEYSLFGAGESTFCIASSPTRKGYIECSFKSVGKVTRALAKLHVGDTVGFRGPYGNHFPMDALEGKNLLFIAGGLGLVPVRCAISYALDNRDRFGDLTVICGARTASDFLYKDELQAWALREDVTFRATVDPGGETPAWTGDVGLLPAIVEKVAPSPDDACAIVSGPSMMIRQVLPLLANLAFPNDRIYATLENRMKCGLGKCGRCNIGPVYVCKDGPVFTAGQIAKLPAEF